MTLAIIEYFLPRHFKIDFTTRFSSIAGMKEMNSTASKAFQSPRVMSVSCQLDHIVSDCILSIESMAIFSLEWNITNVVRADVGWHDMVLFAA